MQLGTKKDRLRVALTVAVIVIRVGSYVTDVRRVVD